MSEQAVLRVTELTKHYGEVRAVDGISFTVDSAAVFTLLGPNGAGKTTTLEILEGIREPDSGEIEAFGQRMRRIDRAAKARMGVLLQEGNFEDQLKVKEVVSLFASFFGRVVSVPELLERVALSEKAGALVKTLSGGQKQRLAVAVALVNDPELVFLDEPTTGLDPQARRNMWGIVEDLKGGGKTLILTTHYMEEAEALSDRVCIMDHGKIIAEGTTRELTADLAQDTRVEFRAGTLPSDAWSALEDCCLSARADEEAVVLETADLPRTMQALLEWSEAHDVPLHHLGVRQPDLEDVFLSLTGRSLRE